jgi:hypothetical protein
MQEKYNQKFPPELIAKAVKLALLMGGNMTGAVNKIEKMKKGLSKDQNVANALRLANESDTTQAFKKIVAESWGKNYESLCDAMKLNPIQSEILKDYLDRGQIKSQYVGKAAGDVKASRIYASKKAYVGSTTNRKEALYNAMKLNLKQQKILDKYISSGNVIGKYQGSMAGTTKETQKYVGMKNFKEHTVSEGKKIQDIVRKHKKELQKAQKSGNLELSKKAEAELSNWASSSGEIRGDDEDEFIDWLDNNLDDLVKGKIKEGKA